MKTYYTFLRSCTGWESFASAEKEVVDTGLTYDEARHACKEYNLNRTDLEIERGTMLEFTEE